MQKTLREALKAVATFNMKNETQEAVKVALLPGIYDALSANGFYSNPANLVNAGYTCDQVADDYDAKDTNAKVKVNGANRVRYRDFLNTVQRVGISVTRIIIQNKNANSQDIYDQEIEVARTAIGAKGGMDFIQLQNYVSVNAYDRSKIEIDLSDEPLVLTPEVFLAMNIPAGANFSIQFGFEAPAYN